MLMDFNTSIIIKCFFSVEKKSNWFDNIFLIIKIMHSKKQKTQNVTQSWLEIQIQIIFFSQNCFWH